MHQKPMLSLKLHLDLPSKRGASIPEQGPSPGSYQAPRIRLEVQYTIHLIKGLSQTFGRDNISIP